MRITNCHIEAFGSLRDRTFDEIDSPVVTILGPNEAGKSTFFRFLKSMLYGIYPTDASKHEYAPHDGRTLQGSLTARTAEGEVCTVARKLMSSPQGQLTRANGTTDLRNQTLPIVSHISEDVFEAVYALSLYDLAALSDEKAWPDIQDRLLGTLSVDYLRSVREVAEEIEGEAAALWRPNRRGNQAVRDLENRLKALRSEARDAAERDEVARELNDQIAALSAAQDKLKRERIELAARKRTIERLRPLRERLAKIHEASVEAGDPDELHAIPDEPEGRLDELEVQIREVSEEINRVETRLESARSASQCVSDRDRALLDAAAEIRSWSKRVTSYMAREDRLEELRRTGSVTAAKVEDRASQLISGPFDDAVADRILELSQPELREAMRSFQEAQGNLDQAHARHRARAEALETEAKVGVRILLLGLLIVGAIAAVVLGSIEFAVSSVLLAAGAFLWMLEGRKRNERLRRLEHSEDLPALRAAMSERRDKLAALLQDIPIPDERLEKPDPYLANELATLQDVLQSLRATDKAASELAADLEHERTNAAELLGRLDKEWAERQDAAIVASELESELDEAERRVEQAKAAELEVVEHERAKERMQEDIEALAKDREDLERALRKLGDGDLATGLETLRRRVKALRRRESFEEGLERDFPAHERLKEEIEELERRGETWEYSDREFVQINERLDELNERIDNNTAKLTAARKDLERLLGEPTLDEIESEREQVRGRIRDLGVERDRLYLLLNVLRRAEQRFRREHQPDVLRRAGEYLQRITGDRYSRLDYEEGTNTLRVFAPGESFGYEVGMPLSQGTRDQIYLAVRMAIVDHLDAGQEPLPVFLDEVFVNWDAERRSRFYTVLEELAGRRQVFLFTCHPWLVDELAEGLPSSVVDLDADTVRA